MLLPRERRFVPGISLVTPSSRAIELVRNRNKQNKLARHTPESLSDTKEGELKMKARLIFVSVLLLALVLSSCAPAATPTEQPMPVEPTTAITGAEGTEAPTEAATEAPTEAATEAPAGTEAPTTGEDP